MSAARSDHLSAVLHRAVRDALEAEGFDYDLVKDQSPLSFSGGEKRRIAIAGILAAEHLRAPRMKSVTSRFFGEE